MSNTNSNANGVPQSLQVSKMGFISGDFKMNQPFLVKNVTANNITVEVQLANMQNTVLTVFYPGWNPELVIKVVNAPANSLLYGN